MPLTSYKLNADVNSYLTIIFLDSLQKEPTHSLAIHYAHVPYSGYFENVTLEFKDLNETTYNINITVFVTDHSQQEPYRQFVRGDGFLGLGPVVDEIKHVSFMRQLRD